ncbi:unnamed protein product [Orchesella dallaii]|uniref:Uncharacterized protein n=1 Tax=Orchesella dallaii TaxID=48710 RepID=A0ABP1S6M6_9HEXA
MPWRIFMGFYESGDTSWVLMAGDTSWVLMAGATSWDLMAGDTLRVLMIAVALHGILWPVTLNGFLWPVTLLDVGIFFCKKVVKLFRLTTNNKICLYPRLPTFKLTDAVKKRITPAESWDTFDVRILTFTDTYERARRKAARAELTSHLKSGDQDDSRLRKRWDRETTVRFNDTSSEEGAFIPANEKILKPKPKRRKNIKQKKTALWIISQSTTTNFSPSFPSPNFCLAPGSGTQRIEHTKLDDFNYSERVEVSEDELRFAPPNADSIDSSIDGALHCNALP